MSKFLSSIPKDRNKIAVFDTEQAIYDVQVFNERVLKLAGLANCPNLLFYHLRPLETKKRLELIEYTIYNTPGLIAVIIDGIRDLVTDINSPEEASIISNKLLKWTEELNIHIITVLHQNKADNNARGHVGTELINKAESVLSIAKDQKQPELSIVTPEFFRGKEFKPFAFHINSEGLPQLTDEFLQPIEETKVKTIMAHQIPDLKHLEVIRDIFPNGNTFHYKELINQIKLGFQAYGQRCGDNKAIEILTYYLNKKWVAKHPAKPYAVYKVGSL